MVMDMLQLIQKNPTYEKPEKIHQPEVGHSHTEALEFLLYLMRRNSNRRLAIRAHIELSLHSHIYT
jgi:hypothetical protein